jgi:hypothetical protein
MPSKLVCLIAIAWIGAENARAADFIFGEDFDAWPVCPAGPTPSFAAVMTPAGRKTRLGTMNFFLAKVRSCGYAGTVNLTPSGAPASWALSVDPTSRSLPSNGSAIALVKAAIPTNGVSGSVPINLNVVASSNTVPLSVNVDAANEILIVIRDGTGSDPNLHPFINNMTMRVGTTVRIVREDSSLEGHVIHASGVAGFVHMIDPGLLQGQENDQTPAAPGTGSLYCHSHGPSALVVVQDP